MSIRAAFSRDNVQSTLLDTSNSLSKMGGSAMWVLGIAYVALPQIRAVGTMLQVAVWLSAFSNTLSNAVQIYKHTHRPRNPALEAPEQRQENEQANKARLNSFRIATVGLFCLALSNLGTPALLGLSTYSIFEGCVGWCAAPSLKAAIEGKDLFYKKIESRDDRQGLDDFRERLRQRKLGESFSYSSPSNASMVWQQISHKSGYAMVGSLGALSVGAAMGLQSLGVIAGIGLMASTFFASLNNALLSAAFVYDGDKRPIPRLVCLTAVVGLVSLGLTAGGIPAVVGWSTSKIALGALGVCALPSLTAPFVNSEYFEPTP